LNVVICCHFSREEFICSLNLRTVSVVAVAAVVVVVDVAFAVVD